MSRPKGLEGDHEGLRTATVAGIQAVDLTELCGRQFEVEHVDVLCDTARLGGLRNHRSPLLQTPTEGERHIETYRVDQYVDVALDKLTAFSEERSRTTDLPCGHTLATLSLKAGVPLKVVSERLGHAAVAAPTRLQPPCTLRRRRAASRGPIACGYTTAIDRSRRNCA